MADHNYAIVRECPCCGMLYSARRIVDLNRVPPLSKSRWCRHCLAFRVMQAFVAEI